MKRDDSIFIEYILDSIQAIEEFSKNMSKDELTINRMKKDAIVREIEIIGEAAKNVSESFKKRHNEIKWKNIIGTRDVMIHQYFGVNLDVVWNIIQEDLSKLKKQLENIKNN